MIKIALTGKMRSGKTSIAEWLELFYGFKQLAFGDALKRFANQIFGYTGPKNRELYQWFGQKMRERDPDVWIKHLNAVFEEIVEDYGNDARIVISDLRQPNEYKYCRAEGFKIIRVNCPEEKRFIRAINDGDVFSRSDFYHETEQYVDKFEVDFEVDNSGTWHETVCKIAEIMEELGVEPVEEIKKKNRQ